jgi:DNA-binding IclR family transcriptional regulator
MAVDITSLSENELKIIRYLQKNPGSRQKEIFADLKMNKATVSNVLKGLVEKSIMSKNESRGTYQCRELSSMS